VKGESDVEDAYDQSILFTCENGIMKPIKNILIGKGVGKKWQLGGESDQSTLYACMEMSK
jgi:hypothetical protein